MYRMVRVVIQCYIIDNYSVTIVIILGMMMSESVTLVECGDQDWPTLTQLLAACCDAFLLDHSFAATIILGLERIMASHNTALQVNQVLDAKIRMS